MRSYFGADFLISSVSEGGLQISAKILEYDLLKVMMAACTKLRPHAFIDVGANLGLYSCILMKNRLAPRAILFEPDRRNVTYLRANLLINDLAGENIQIHAVALGAATSTKRLTPGPASDIGRSTIASLAPGAYRHFEDKEGYDVKVRRFDDIAAMEGQTLAIKIDVEGYEREVIVGMNRTLRNNGGIVQIEVFDEHRNELVRAMQDLGYSLVWDFPDFPPNLVFCKQVPVRSGPGSVPRTEIMAPTLDPLRA